MKNFKNSHIASIVFVTLLTFAFFVGTVISSYGDRFNITVFTEASHFLKTNYNLMLFCSAVLCLAIMIVMAIKLKVIYKKIINNNYNDDENSVYSFYTNTISIINACSIILQTVATFLIIITIRNLISNDGYDLLSGIDTFFFFTTDISLLFVFLLNMYITNLVFVKIISKVQPEKSKDIWSLNFNKKYIDTLDEYELQKQGKSALVTGSLVPIIYVVMVILGFLIQMDTSYYIGITIFTVVFLVVALINDIKNKTNLP